MTLRQTAAGTLALLLACLTANAQETRVAKWEPHDFSFPSAAAPGNPFEVPFSAEITGPSGSKTTLPGFFDGNGTWKIRFSPTTEGPWTITTKSTAPDLDGKTVTFTCAGAPSKNNHGPLRIDPRNRRQFTFEDGTHFFTSGYECDWLWALDVGDPTLKVTNAFLDKLVDHGFNYIILNTYAHDTSWRKGKTGPDDLGPPPLYAWEGTNDAPDHSRLNLAYWQHYDLMMNALHQRGIVAHILVKVYNKQVKWPEKNSPEEARFFNFLLARYSAYPNITWDFAKEAQYEKDVDYKVEKLKFFKSADPNHHLVTIHDDKAVYDKGTYNDVVDYRSDQQHKIWRESMQDHLKQNNWPVINTEYGYEHGPGGIKDKTYSQVQPPEEVIRRAWEVYMAGGTGCYYYTYTAWDVLRTEDTPPGYAYYKHLSAFFKATDFWSLAPADGVTTEGAALANPGTEYVVYLDEAKPFTLTLPGLKGPAKATWFNPLTGESTPGPKVAAGTTEVTPPAGQEGMIVLHVKAEAK